MFVSDFTAAKKVMRREVLFNFSPARAWKKNVLDFAVGNKVTEEGAGGGWGGGERRGFLSPTTRPKSNQQQYVTVFKTPIFLISPGLLEEFEF